jgi:hypothetical protein
MRIGQVLALLCICFAATAQEQKITATGKLVRAMAIGGESTGWTIQLDSEIDIGGKQVHSIEVASQDATKLKQFETSTSGPAARSPIGTESRGATALFSTFRLLKRLK